MAYQKQTFTDGKTILTAEMMRHIEEGISKVTELAEETKRTIDNLGNVSNARIGTVTLTANGWKGTGNLFSQVVNIEGATVNSQIDLNPSIEQLAIFYEKDLTFVTENNDGVITVYAIGQLPQNDYTMQVTISEVA
jgi:hypothetical protein